MSGLTGYCAGLAAEDIVLRDYERRGFGLASKRWRGKSGEIDLILRDEDAIIFVEVKKSRSFAQAAARLRPKQVQRLCAAATEFVAGEPNGQLTDMRFDVAMVDGAGRVEVLENAIAADFY